MPPGASISVTGMIVRHRQHFCFSALHLSQSLIEMLVTFVPHCVQRLFMGDRELVRQFEQIRVVSFHFAGRAWSEQMLRTCADRRASSIRNGNAPGRFRKVHGGRDFRVSYSSDDLACGDHSEAAAVFGIVEIVPKQIDFIRPEDDALKSI